MSWPLRITHAVRSDGFAGVERYIADVANALADRGHDVSVIGGGSAFMGRALSPQVRFVPASTTAAVARALWASEQQDVVHAHMTAAELAVAPLKGVRFERLVSTRHFAAVRGSSVASRVAGRWVARRVDLQIAISQYVADRIDDASEVVHNGVPSSTHPRGRRDRTVVMLQRLEAEKDTGTGIRAWAASGLAASGWSLRVFGTGADQDALRTLAHELGVDSGVTFEGFTDQARTVLARAGMVLATAPAEPFGLSVVEAMAEGAPVIAADGGAHRETLGPGAALFEPGDVGAAADLLRSWAADETRRDEYGESLRERHREHFTVQAHVDRLEALYRG